jgi:prophage tail gpP-like protein
MNLPMRLAPQLPPGWRFLRVRNLRWRDSTFDLELMRDSAGASVRVTPRSGANVPLELELTLPPGAEVLPSKNRRTWAVAQGDQSRGVRVSLSGRFAAEESIPLRYRPGIEIAPVNDPLQPGDESRRLRIIDARLEGRTYTVRVQGRSGQRYRLRLEVPFAVATITGGHEIGQDGPARIVEVALPEDAKPWVGQTLTVTIGKRLAGPLAPQTARQPGKTGFRP